MLVYKVRRITDNKFVRHDARGGMWGAGQTYSEAAFKHAVRLFNLVGGHYIYAHENQIYRKEQAVPFRDLELVEINMDTGEHRVIASGEEIKDADALLKGNQ
jgi:hypothetical protein